ncbi:hypothetical protein HMPREF1554_00952 [Porphyromonas gingivalis F0569]|uniref:Uncharacterized protein n=1 Tax=Porphyromonas gingivalis F0570 TaxID=1227271 RepID=A0A0E2M3S8_PORGN|nr:hypothetical protein HMPREF1555_01766 [Porphyromonas gingivalis F0570]ERJ67564.1 hypothetical protein HMPREF1554_00952 [Porphyromonas gingivalis F0569]ERJ84953.1 hypothetical protein HMPREF1989_01759 [Porphyromonas gingivalis F0566]
MQFDSRVQSGRSTFASSAKRNESKDGHPITTNRSADSIISSIY